MMFSLATVTTDRAVAALEIEGCYWPLDALRRHGLAVPALDVKTLLQDWHANFSQLQQLAMRCADDPSLAPLMLAPEAAGQGLELAIQYPNKLIAVGANYAGHLAEMGLPQKRWQPMPFFFMPPTTTMVGSGKQVLRPRGCAQFDWEVELAVVMGQRLCEGTRQQAAAAIAGYAVAIDLSARDLTLPPDFALLVDLARGKSQDSMCPFGPSLRPAAFVSNPQDLRLRLSVNGVLRQDASTSDMLYSIDELLADISQHVTLEPGDVILTGSPAGSAQLSGQFLQPGDRIVAEIDGVGRLEVEVTDERARMAAQGRQF